ncbi:hypothetical protein DSUL_150084 [Desulfovibrionales bacterium]
MEGERMFGVCISSIDEGMFYSGEFLYELEEALGI